MSGTAGRCGFSPRHKSRPAHPLMSRATKNQPTKFENGMPWYGPSACHVQ